MNLIDGELPQSVMNVGASKTKLKDIYLICSYISRSLHLCGTNCPNCNSNFLYCSGLSVYCSSLLFHPKVLPTNIETAAFHGSRSQESIIVSISTPISTPSTKAKIPCSTQFIESLSGLATIRAFGWQQNERDLNLQLLDTSQKPFYLLYMIQQWLALVLNLVGMALALVLTGLAVKLREVVSPGFTGVALVQIIGFNITLQSLVVWCESDCAA